MNASYDYLSVLELVFGENGLPIAWVCNSLIHLLRQLLENRNGYVLVSCN